MVDIPKTIHLATTGRSLRETNPLDVGFGQQTGALVTSSVHNALSQRKATEPALQALSDEQIAKFAEASYMQGDIRHPHEEASKGFLKTVKKDGLRLPKVSVAGRFREFKENRHGNIGNASVIEGQDKRLYDATFRDGKMTSKQTALDAPKNAKKTYKPLKGNALRAYTSQISKILRIGGRASATTVKAATQKAFVAEHLKANAAKLLQFCDTHHVALNENQSINSRSVSELLADLGLDNHSINTTCQLQDHLIKKGALGSAVWSIVEQLQLIQAKTEQVYKGQPQDWYFNHDKGGVVAQSPQQADLQKMVGVLAQKILDRPLEAKLLETLKGQNVKDARYCGNPHNIDLYGAAVKGLDMPRDAAFRATLGMTAKSIVVDALQTLQGEALSRYVGKLSANLAEEFLWLMDVAVENGDALATLLSVCQNNADSLNTLSRTYISCVYGPCGNMQRAGFEVGLVLSAVQHLTGETSLYCAHNGDFAEVAGLQNDPANRTYMKVKPGTEVFNIFAVDPELVHTDKDEYFIPIDCVHSQVLLNLPGCQEEATRILRMTMADIIPDIENLEVRIAGTAALKNGADKPYNSDSVAACSRFADYPHLYKVGENRNQEDCIIEALEFVYHQGETTIPLLIATQHHDDAEKGSKSWQDYSNDTAVDERPVINNDGAKRNVVDNRTKHLVDRALGRTQAPDKARPVSVVTPRSPSEPASETMATLEKTERSFFGKLIDQLFLRKTADSPAPTVEAENIEAQFIEAEELSQEQQDLDTLKQLIAKRWWSGERPSLKNDDLQRNGELFKTVALEHSPEARLFEIIASGGQLPQSAQEISDRVDQAHRQGMPDLHRLVVGFDDVATHIERFLKPKLKERKASTASGADTAPGKGKLKLFHRPLRRWQGADKRTSSLPGGTIGTVAVGPTAAGALNTTAAVVPAAKAAAGITATAGTGLAGGLLITQGAFMTKSVQATSRRLGKLSKEKQASFDQSYNLWSALRSNSTLEAERNNAIAPLKTRLAEVNNTVQHFKQQIADCQAPALADKKAGFVEALDAISKQIQQTDSHQVLEICDIRTLLSSLSLATSICAYMKEQQASVLSNEVTEAGTALLAEVTDWGMLLDSDRFTFETQCINQLESHNTALRELKSARKDNEVMRWTGLGYGAAGGAFVAAASAPLAAALSALGPVGTGILTLVYTGNALNTLRDQRRTAAAELDVQGQYPWAPKVVGFHRSLLTTQAAQVEADRMKNEGLGPRTAGWGLGAAAMAGLTITGATATALSGGAALPVVLGVGVGLSVVINASTYNLFNRHAARGAPFGARPESSAHADGMDSDERKRLFWSLSKQLPQTLELKHRMLEQLDNNVKKALAAEVNLYPMKKGAKSPLLSHKSLVYTTDSRRKLNYFVEKFFNPNYSRIKQAKAIRKAFTADWKADVHNACYSFRLYSEHESNTLRDSAKSLVGRLALVDRQIKSFTASNAGDDILAHLHLERDAIDKRIHEVAGQMRGVKSFAKALHTFEKEYHYFKHSGAADQQQDAAMKANFETLITDFAHRMGLLGSLYSRGVTKQLAEQFSQDLKVDTYGNRQQHIANARCQPDRELSADFRAKLNEDAFKNLANLLVFSLPDMLQYEVQKLLQTELHLRKPDLELAQALRAQAIAEEPALANAS